MNLEQAIEKILLKHDELKESKDSYLPEAVWISISDKSEGYDVDEERIGIKKDGTLVWAYASGCSCWEGYYEIHETHDPKEWKAMTFNHFDIHADWEKLIIEYATKL